MEKKISVLMVDDEEQFRETTAKILGRKGFDVTMAATGEEAVDILKKGSRDVVVLDMKMPGMDGKEALAAIRKIHPAAQVIMLTGHGAMESAKASLELGAYDFLNKPCDIDLLALKIKDARKAADNGEVRKERRISDIMIRIDDYTKVQEESTVKEAFEQLMKSFKGFVSTSRVMETGHRSVLVYDKKGEITGILSIRDLIGALRPAYLSMGKPSTADSIQFSPMFWKGLFVSQAGELAGKKVWEVMSDAPPVVDESANLMELANMMYAENIRRAVVKDKGRIVGVVREQEVFFEMAGIILKE